LILNIHSFVVLLTTVVTGRRFETTIMRCVVFDDDALPLLLAVLPLLVVVLPLLLRRSSLAKPPLATVDDGTLPNDALPCGCWWWCKWCAMIAVLRVDEANVVANAYVTLSGLAVDLAVVRYVLRNSDGGIKGRTGRLTCASDG